MARKAITTRTNKRAWTVIPPADDKSPMPQIPFEKGEKIVSILTVDDDKEING
jgi:hypothetical protein